MVNIRQSPAFKFIMINQTGLTHLLRQVMRKLQTVTETNMSKKRHWDIENYTLQTTHTQRKTCPKKQQWHTEKDVQDTHREKHAQETALVRSSRNDPQKKKEKMPKK